MKDLLSWIPTSPRAVVAVGRLLLPPLLFLCLGAFIITAWLIINSPPDYLQGQAVKIMFIHVPAAYLASICYFGLAICCFGFLGWRQPLLADMANSIALVGLLFTIICLLTGSIWGKPMWGTWWVWDARLTSVFVLLLLYVGQIGLARSMLDYRPAALVAGVGLVNLPIIKFSVAWWQTLHQGSSLLRKDGPTIAPQLLTPLLWSLFAFTVLALIFFLWLFQGRLYKKMVKNYYVMKGKK
ncbi:MAG: heme ABC transporter permease CcmC [Alphaproteobacteria bacterium]|nr:heme ABC transporter permease CcmC [Alphaproteobacteria bacterium]